MSEIDLTNPESEPVAVRTVVAAATAIAVDVFVALGVHLSPDWQSVVGGAAHLAVLAALAWAVRRRVFSPATVSAMLSARGTRD